MYCCHRVMIWALMVGLVAVILEWQSLCVAVGQSGPLYLQPQMHHQFFLKIKLSYIYIYIYIFEKITFYSYKVSTYGEHRWIDTLQPMINTPNLSHVGKKYYPPKLSVTLDWNQFLFLPKLLKMSEG
jgi:hypothetical protein